MIYLKDYADVCQRIENSISGKTEEVGEALMVGAGDEDSDIE
jgi:hypothetical protein